MNPTEKDPVIIFNKIKAEIVHYTKMLGGVQAEERLQQFCKANTLAELMQVIKDNFSWACGKFVVTPSLIEEYREEFASNNIYLNTNVEDGYLLCDNVTVDVSGHATVIARCHSKVRAYDNAIVETCDNTLVSAYDSSTVKAYGKSMIEAKDCTTVEANNNATVSACGHATVKACDEAVVRAYGSVTVEATGNAYCFSFSPIKCKLSGSAIYRIAREKTIRYASDTLTFKKQE